MNLFSLHRVRGIYGEVELRDIDATFAQEAELAVLCVFGDESVDVSFVHVAFTREKSIFVGGTEVRAARIYRVVAVASDSAVHNCSPRMGRDVHHDFVRRYARARTYAEERFLGENLPLSGAGSWSTGRRRPSGRGKWITARSSDLFASNPRGRVTTMTFDLFASNI